MPWRQVIKLPNTFMAVGNAGKYIKDANVEQKFVFLTNPKVGKMDMRLYLQNVYGVRVKKVNSINVQGGYKRRGPRGYVFKEKDYKRFIVTLDDESPPLSMPTSPE
jgi:ribosomal protein L23